MSDLVDPNTGEVIGKISSGDVTGAPVGGTRPISDDEAKGLEDPSLMPFEGGKVPPSNEALVEEVKEKLKDKNPEAVKADISAEAANPAVGGKPGVADRSAEKTVQREDSTLTTNLQPELTAHYIGGNRVMITEQQKVQFDRLAEDLDKELAGRAFNDIPLGDRYFELRKELDSFVARLRR